MPKLAGFTDFSKVEAEKINDKITRRMVCGDHGMLVHWTMKKGAHGAAHKHPHEQIVWMISGRMDFRIGNEKRMMVAGDTAIIPGGVEHEGFFPEDTVVIDFFAPPREDFLARGPPPYMRNS
jgi:quercetin dioxygenase-like cupin family protein